MLHSFGPKTAQDNVATPITSTTLPGRWANNGRKLGWEIRVYEIYLLVEKAEERM
jgi:hypothetical protein